MDPHQHVGNYYLIMYFTHSTPWALTWYITYRLTTVFFTHVENCPTKTVYIWHYMDTHKRMHIHTITSRNWVLILVRKYCEKRKVFSLALKDGRVEVKVLWEQIPNVGFKARESAKAMKLVFYAQSTITVISGWYINTITDKANGLISVMWKEGPWWLFLHPVNHDCYIIMGETCVKRLNKRKNKTANFTMGFVHRNISQALCCLTAWERMITQHSPVRSWSTEQSYRTSRRFTSWSESSEMQRQGLYVQNTWIRNGSPPQAWPPNSSGAARTTASLLHVQAGSGAGAISASRYIHDSPETRSMDQI